MSIHAPYISDKEQQHIIERAMTGRLQYSLMNDFLAKYSLQNDLYALTGLLAALLHIDIDTITNIEILNPIKPGDVINDKSCVLDLNLEMNNTHIVNIEIQTRYQEFWPERSITYLCRNFNHLKTGNNYGDIMPCLHIGILNHSLFKNEDPRYTDEFYSEYAILNKLTHTEYSSKFEIRVLSLCHLENASPEDKEQNNGLYYWAKLFTANSWEELRMTAQNNPRMQSFIGTVRKLSADEEVAQACEARLRYSIEIATYEKMIEDAKQQAEAAILDAEAAKQDAEAAKQDAEAAKQDAKAAKQDAEAAKQDAEAAKQDAENMRMENERLKRLLKDLSIQAE